MKIALGADSAGKPLLDVIEAHLKSKPEHEVTNLSQAGFYAEWKTKFGDEAWAILERAVGKLS